MPISPRICKSDRHSCSCSFVYSVREISTATCIPSLKFRPETTPILTNLGAERATHCYIVHYARANMSAFRRTCLADWVRMALRFLLERGDKVRERLAFGILILLLICLFAFTFAVLGKGEYEPTGEKPQQLSQ